MQRLSKAFTPQNPPSIKHGQNCYRIDEETCDKCATTYSKQAKALADAIDQSVLNACYKFVAPQGLTIENLDGYMGKLTRLEPSTTTGADDGPILRMKIFEGARQQGRYNRPKIIVESTPSSRGSLISELFNSPKDPPPIKLGGNNTWTITENTKGGIGC